MVYLNFLYSLSCFLPVSDRSVYIIVFVSTGRHVPGRVYKGWRTILVLNLTTHPVEARFFLFIAAYTRLADLLGNVWGLCSLNLSACSWSAGVIETYYLCLPGFTLVLQI